MLCKWGWIESSCIVTNLPKYIMIGKLVTISELIYQ